jgi:hypothetical protein
VKQVILLAAAIVSLTIISGVVCFSTGTTDRLVLQLAIELGYPADGEIAYREQKLIYSIAEVGGAFPRQNPDEFGGYWTVQVINFAGFPLYVGEHGAYGLE